MAMIDIETAERIALDCTVDDNPNGLRAVAVQSERDLLVVSGPDSASYLQGQLSQNVEGLDVGATAWTLLLQPQGKVDAWLRLHRLADDRFLLDGDAGAGRQAFDRLERFKLRVEVAIELATVPILAVRGPGARNVTGPEGHLVLDATWGGVDGVDVLARPGEPGDSLEGEGGEADRDVDALLNLVVAESSLAVGPPALLDVVRVLQGLPAAGSELNESTIPAAARIVDRSVDFTKGCYVGQELVARIDSRGNNVPTRLVGLRFEEGTMPEPGTDLELDGAPAGTVTTVASSATRGPVGLAYVRRAVEVPGPVLAVTGPAETVELPDP